MGGAAAKQMPYDDAYGNHYEGSYWRLVQLNLGIADGNASAVFYGYRTEEDRRSGKQSIGNKQYSVSGEKFDRIAAEHLAPGGPNVVQIAYKIAAETKDVPAPTPEDPDRKVSFFEGGEDLL